MNTTQILQTLKSAGLNTYEAKCYLALFERDTLTVPEVSKLAGIPRPNAYEALENLLSKGMCVARPGNTKRYGPSDPAILEEKLHSQAAKATEIEIANLEKKEEQILEKAKAAENNINSLISDLKPRYEEGTLKLGPLDYIEIVKGSHQIHKRFMQLVAEAEHEILAFTKPPYTNPREKLEEQVGQGVGILKRGVQVRCIYETARDEDEKRWQLEMINRAVSAGEEARVLEELPMKMAIFDSRIALYTLSDRLSRRLSWTSQIVEHPDFAVTLKIVFETLWQQAKDYHILED